MKPEQAVLTWAARRHPSPSRLGRTIEQVQEFTRSAVALAQDIPFIPLTCDAGTFQVLVPASKTLEYVRAITLLYIECFGRVLDSHGIQRRTGFNPPDLGTPR